MQTTPHPAQREVLARRLEQPREDHVDVVADVAGLGVLGDVDGHGGDAQDFAEEELDEEGLAAPGGADEQVVLTGSELREAALLRATGDAGGARDDRRGPRPRARACSCPR